ncbi:hypothetical protein N7522_000524 [Penicillium canescens]|uniref:Uncharacterized protein n=1 Tax=Penicillium canescens TaxID=5083 RepID=A0AAD6N819_PENCN|nr:hypothetical protein N7522_000524 [Penicillium canescens]KAJ6039111.1 hypothetical protein N7460_007143 [Penicillium canescens]KAJ6174456.1 hypothetical protein N7485_005522 [Penicillium canescens]
MMESIDEEFVHFRYGQGYFADTDAIREQWYPLLNGVAGITYLDHAGTTLRAKSFIESFLDAMYRADRRRATPSSPVLQCKPDEFDVVFVANTTAAIGESFRDDPRGFWYGYCVDSHTGVIGVWELTDMGCQCFDDTDVDAWICELGTAQPKIPKLFAFPAQPDMSGRRLPLQWCEQIRSATTTEGMYPPCLMPPRFYQPLLLT